MGQPSLSRDELDALLAPIALYPDGLLYQVLMASTYPLEVVHANRFIKENSELHGAELDDALGKKNWDPSVQSLAAYPKVLAMMSEKLEWTESLGNAVLDDEARVMDTLQSLRRRAEAVENLNSTAERSVVHDQEMIVIEPAESEVVYVPIYDAAVVYGAYASAYYYYYQRYYGSASVSVSYSESYSISREHWGWAHADWRNHRFTMAAGNNRFWNQAGHTQAAAGTAWQHEPMHRGGVGYPTAATQNRFAGPERGPQSMQPPKDMPSHGPGQGLPDRGMQGAPRLPSGAPPGLGSMGPSSALPGGPPSLGSMGPPGGFPGGLPPAPPGPPPFPH
jgi:hypothetical protein